MHESTALSEILPAESLEYIVFSEILEHGCGGEVTSIHAVAFLTDIGEGTEFARQSA